MQVPCAILIGLLLWVFSPNLTAHAESRFALLIGNQGYTDKIGRLTNPHNDIALVGAALEKVGFEVTRIRDAGYKTIDTALKRHIQQVRHAGKDTISFFYYSGHGASDPDTEINYLIPTDVEGADEANVWTNSIELGDVVSRLRDQSPLATHYVVFDACREELHLTREGKKAMGAERGFVAIGSVSGVMIAYATAPGKTASDVGEASGFYAKALSEEIIKPGVEAVTMFRNVQLKVKDAIGQDPWLSFPSLPAVYFAGKNMPEGLSPEREIEKAFWESVKGSKDPAVLDAYVERYPKGEFAPTARALIAQYELQLAERAVREEARRKQNEALKAAEVRRLEEERRLHETPPAVERRRAKGSKDSREATPQEDKSRRESAAIAEELRNALEEIRIAREAAKAAEQQRAAAIRSAEEAASRARLASLPPTEDQHRIAETLADDPTALARALRSELKRVGCDPGDLDGVWGAKAKDALANFARLTNKTLPSDTPTSEALQAVLGQKGRICAPLKRDGPRAATAKDLPRAAKSGGEDESCGFGFRRGGGVRQRPGYGCR
jgi:hypothetical protein